MKLFKHLSAKVKAEPVVEDSGTPFSAGPFEDIEFEDLASRLPPRDDDAPVGGSAASAVAVDGPGPASQNSYVPEEEAPPSRWQRIRQGRSRTAATAFEAPIRVLIGFLPEVSKADALEFARGVAGKHAADLGLAYFDAYSCDNGFAYEVHEGGAGRAYLPAILKYYKTLGSFSPEDDNKVAIHTGTRTVEVARARAGISAVLLPEGQKPPSPYWLVPGASMRSAVNLRTGVLTVGAVVFVTGFVAAVLSGMAFRLQPYEDAPATAVDSAEYSRLPASQWALLQNSRNGDQYIKALRFKDGAWSREMGKFGAPAAPAAAAAAAASAPSGVAPSVPHPAAPPSGPPSVPPVAP